MTDKNLNILIVEDNPGDIRLVQEMLLEDESSPFRIEGAGTLEDGLEVLRANIFDIILLDLGLPDSRGLSTLEHILAKESKIPIIVFTGLDDEDLGAQAVSMGAQDYLIKGQITRDRLIQAIRYAIERKRIQNELNRYKDNLEDMVYTRTLEIQKREERFRRMAETMHDGLTIIENRKVVYINDRMCDIIGCSKRELIGMSEISYAAPEEKARLKEILVNFQKYNKLPTTLEFWIVQKNGERRYIRNRYSASYNQEKIVEQYILTTDITDKKTIDDEKKKRLMKYSLEDGNMYLVKESRPVLARDAFDDILKIGYDGVIISRTSRKELSRDISCNFTHVWLGESEDNKKLSILKGSEDFEELLNALGEKNAVLIDRLDYLVFKNGMENTLALVYRLRDIAYLRRIIVILSLDPAAITEEALKQLEKETLGIQQKQGPQLSEELLEIIEIIFNKNKEDIAPSYSDIGDELGVSKPTTRKKVRRLIAGNYVIEVQKGNRKILELTPKGRGLLFR